MDLKERLEREGSIDILRDRLDRRLGDRLAADPDGFCVALARHLRNRPATLTLFDPERLPETAALAERRDPREAAKQRHIADEAVAGRVYAPPDSRNQTFLGYPPGFDFRPYGGAEERLLARALSRHVWYACLARSYWLRRERHYLDALEREWDFFQDRAPAADEAFRGGTHGIGAWRAHLTSPYWELDVSVRATMWYWAFWLSLFAPETTPERITINLARCLINFDVVVSTGVVDKRCNHTAMHGEGVYLWASSLPEVIGMEAWRHNTRVLLESSLAEAVLADGVQYEMSPSYQAGCIRWYGGPALAARRRGEPFEPEYLNRLRALGESSDALQCPDLSDAPLSDSVRNPGNLQALALARVLTPDFRTRRPCSPSHYSIWVSNGMDWEPEDSVAVKPRHVTFPKGGYAILMTDTRPTAAYAVLDCGPIVFPHNQLDILALYWEAFGQQVLADPGMYRLIGDDKRTWVRSAASHNLIMPEEKPPEPPGYSDQGPAVFFAVEAGDDPRMLPLRTDDLGDVLRIGAGHRLFTMAPEAQVERTVWMSGDGAQPWLVVRDRIASLRDREWTSSWLLPGNAPLITDGHLQRMALATGVHIALATAGLEDGRILDDERFYTTTVGVIEPARQLRQTASCMKGTRVSAWSAALGGPAPDIRISIDQDDIILDHGGSTRRLH